MPRLGYRYDERRSETHLFIAETKGSMSSMDLSAIEKAKIACAEKLFNSISTANVKYHKVATYQDLIDEMNAG